MSQRNMVLASLSSTAARDMNGPLHRHVAEADVLRVEVARLRRALAVALDGREAALEAYLTVTGRFASKQRPERGES